MTRKLALVALLVPALALAQEGAAPRLQEDPRAAKYRDVERGFFVAFEGGYLRLLDTPAASDPESFPLAREPGGPAGGPVIGALVGVDILKRISVALFLQGGNQRASVNYGAFSLYSGGVDLKVAVFGRKDRNDWERLYVYLHGRGGLAKTFPAGLFGEQDVIFSGGLGFEYFTQLRHFSVGLAADAVYATKAAVAGVAVYPTLRYTF